MSMLLANEQTVGADESIVRIFVASPAMQSEWQSAQSTYGDVLFPNLYDLARQYFVRSPEMRSKWQEYQHVYGKTFYPDLDQPGTL